MSSGPLVDWTVPRPQYLAATFRVAGRYLGKGFRRLRTSAAIFKPRRAMKERRRWRTAWRSGSLVSTPRSVDRIDGGAVNGWAPRRPDGMRASARRRDSRGAPARSVERGPQARSSERRPRRTEKVEVLA